MTNVDLSAEKVGRPLEIAAGSFMGLVALAFLSVAIYVLVVAPYDPAIIAIVVVIGLLGTWFARLSWRLVSGRGRSDGGLFSPWALTGWAILFFVTGIAAAIEGIVEGEWQLVLLGVGCGLFSVGIWRFRRVRVRRAT